MANEKYTVYMGTEKFRPAEGYFANTTKTVIGYTDEYNDFYANGYHVYISPYFEDEAPSQSLDGLQPMILCAIAGNYDACILVKYNSGHYVEGGNPSSDYWSSFAGKEGSAAFNEGRTTGTLTSDIAYVKIYVFDYNALYNKQATEEYWDTHATLIAQLNVEYDASEDRYVWTM